MKTKKFLLGIIVGGILFSVIGALGANIFSSRISYTSHNNTTVEDALANNRNKRYLDGEIVYYNPVTDAGCSQSTYNSNSNKYGTTGCMRWFVYLDTNESSIVHLLLNHNTQSQVR